MYIFFYFEQRTEFELDFPLRTRPWIYFRSHGRNFTTTNWRARERWLGRTSVMIAPTPTTLHCNTCLHICPSTWSRKFGKLSEAVSAWRIFYHSRTRILIVEPRKRFCGALAIRNVNAHCFKGDDEVKNEYGLFGKKPNGRTSGVGGGWRTRTAKTVNYYGPFFFLTARKWTYYDRRS